MGQIRIREDLRRDGLSINFLVDETLMLHLARTFPYSRINIGYPAICPKEEEMCRRIAETLRHENVETAVVGHARKDHLEVMSSIVNEQHNSSANFWIPISDYFIGRTLKKGHREVLRLAGDMIKFWKEYLSNAPIDVALVDCTAKERGLRERLCYFYEEIKDTGARSVIVCDSRGIGTTKGLTHLLADFGDNSEDIEFHPHDDSGLALSNIETVLALGIKFIGTSVYGLGERATMVDPRKLVARYNVPYNPSEFELFDNGYKSLIRSLAEKEKVFTENTIITGPQYSLLGRNKNKILKFGVTTDKYMLSKMLGIDIHEISEAVLMSLKDELYKDKKRVYNSEELTRKLKKLSLLKNGKQRS